VVRDLRILDASNLFRVATVLLLIVAMRSASERVHAALFAISVILMVAFVGLFQFRLA